MTIKSLKTLPKYTSAGSIIFVLTDENTFKHCYSAIVHHLPQHHIIRISSGEENKTLATCEVIWKKLTEANADRKGILVNLGGGVIGDIGGFAAGCYKRGIRSINIPTTLLAMVDASVGGKTGIDFLGYKNQIGLFNEPEAVIVHTPFLKTLPERELTSGFAEVIKHYLIADKGEFKRLLAYKPSLTKMKWDKTVTRNIKIKSVIVKKDPFEKNIRKALNFGHTIGHGVESYFLRTGQSLLHGEAVAIGMLTEGFISLNKKLVTEKELKMIVELITHYFDLPLIPKPAYKEILQLIKQDKKNKGLNLQLTLLKGIGNYSINNSVEEAIIAEAIDYYNTVLA